MVSIETITTAEQLLRAADLGPCELVGGELIMMSPAGFRHGRVANRLSVRLGRFVEGNSLGVVTTAEAGFRIGRSPDTVRVPDIAFVRADRVPPTEPAGFFEGPPDLAVEVVSPNDRASEVLAKAQDWLDAGCGMVWVVDPQTATVSVYRNRSEVVILRGSESLAGGDILPGFTLPVGDIFGR
jgi:Uma2 family endonuclease